MPQSPNVVGKSTDDKAASQRQMVPADLCLGGAPGRVCTPGPSGEGAPGNLAAWLGGERLLCKAAEHDFRVNFLP